MEVGYVARDLAPLTRDHGASDWTVSAKGESENFFRKEKGVRRAHARQARQARQVRPTSSLALDLCAIALLCFFS